jgi:transcriptional regulator (fragment)
MTRLSKEHYPWVYMMDKDMLRSYVKDSETNKEEIALAAILLLGTDNALCLCPHYIRQNPFSECLMRILHMNIVI